MSRSGKKRVTGIGEFTVRQGTGDDLDTLTEQRVSMYREMYPDLPLDYKSYSKAFRAWARKLMRRKKLVSFLVVDGRGKPVAGGTLWIREYQPSARYPGTETPYLMSMFTDPAHRRKGLATLVVREAIRWSRDHGYSRVTLHASAMGEPVYAKLGFERTTEMRLLVGGPPVKKGLPQVQRRRNPR